MELFNKSSRDTALSTNKDAAVNRSEKQNQSVRHIAHDINNILTRILNSVELIKKKIPDDNDIKPLLASIENGTFLAAEIIEDVVLETSDKQPRKRKINLNTLINDLVNSLDIHLKDKIQFILRFDKDIQFVEGRYSDYYRVIMNLIINASEAVKDKGTITIATFNTAKSNSDQKDITFFDAGKFVEISVKDNGAGIEKSVMPHIFEEKFTTKSKKNNSGYGLSIVKKIVDENNGAINVKSEMNKGTEFILRFPVVDIQTNDGLDHDKFILVAEDDEIQRMLLSELLESYNYKITAVSNGRFLFEELSKKHYDLLIIDNKMPDMDGLQCINKIKEMKFNIPIILATGSQASIDDMEIIKNSVDRRIGKPYDFDDMLNLIQELVG